MNVPSENEHRTAVSWRWAAVGLLLAVLAIPLLTRSARQSSSGPDAAETVVEEVAAAQRDELFDYAVDSLNRLEEFDTSEMLKQAVDRLDNWIHDQQKPESWKVDPMVATLPEPFGTLPVVAELDKLAFTLDPPSSDGWALQEAVWLRELSNWARGDQIGDLDMARHLFDWTVRNIQLDGKPPEQGDGPPIRLLQKPWETLMFGHGSARERARVFILLARNQGLDAAMIGPVEATQGEDPEKESRLVGVLSGEDIYLFDPELGLPVPAPDGVKLDDDGRLVAEPASLAQVVAADALLRRLDAGDGYAYPLRASQLDGAVAWLDASPSYLSLRMKLVETRLAGEDKLVLTADPTGQAERFKRSKHVAEVRLGTLPYRTVLEEMQYPQHRQKWQLLTMMPFRVGVEQSGALWKGRSYHLKGLLEGTPGATAYYQMARPSNRQIDGLRADDQLKAIILRGKLSASYWLGLVAAHQGNDRAAVDYLEKRLIKFSFNNPWLHGAVYNLARIFEVVDLKMAIGLYLTDADSPAHHGNRLRARWLEELTGVKAELPPPQEPAATPAQKSPDEKPDRPPPEKPGKEPAEKPKADPPTPSGGRKTAPSKGKATESSP